MTELTKTELTNTEPTKTELTQPAELKGQLVLSEAALLPVAFREPLPPHRTRGLFSWRLDVALGVAALVIVTAGIYGRYYWTVGRFLESTDDAYVQADSTIVAPKVSGYLSEVLVADNQPVKAGQALAKIDDRDYVAALDQAKADVTTAQADIEKRTLAKAAAGRHLPGPRHRRVDQANLTFAEQDNARYEPSPIAGPAVCRMPSRRYPGATPRAPR